MSGEACPFACHLCCDVCTAILLLADSVGRESVSGYDVGACLDVKSVDILDDLGCRQAENVVVASQRNRMRSEAFAVKVFGRQPKLLNLRAHSTVQNEDALSQQVPYVLKSLFHFRMQNYEEKLRFMGEAKRKMKKTNWSSENSACLVDRLNVPC